MVHEYTHGIIESTSELIYEGETGATYASYADLMAVFSGRDTKIDRGPFAQGDMNWTFAENRFMPRTHTPTRDISNPANPNVENVGTDHYTNYWFRPVDEANDWGGVHFNS